MNRVHTARRLEQTRPHRRTVSPPPEALSGTFAEVYPRLPQELQRELDLSRIICSSVNHTGTALRATSRVE